jgi:hypothetical protein
MCSLKGYAKPADAWIFVGYAVIIAGVVLMVMFYDDDLIKFGVGITGALAFLFLFYLCFNLKGGNSSNQSNLHPLFPIGTLFWVILFLGAVICACITRVHPDAVALHISRSGIPVSVLLREPGLYLKNPALETKRLYLGAVRSEWQYDIKPQRDGDPYVKVVLELTFQINQKELPILLAEAPWKVIVAESPNELGEKVRQVLDFQKILSKLSMSIDELEREEIVVELTDIIRDILSSHAITLHSFNVPFIGTFSVSRG